MAITADRSKKPHRAPTAKFSGGKFSKAISFAIKKVNNMESKNFIVKNSIYKCDTKIKTIWRKYSKNRKLNYDKISVLF